MTAGEISRRLAQHIDSLVIELLPNGRRRGHEWIIGDLSGSPGDSLSIRLTGEKRGIWCDFATGQSGDALALVCAVLGYTTPQAMAWALKWLGEDHPTRQPQSAARAAKEQTPTSELWQPIWREGRRISGTVAEIYLHARGGLVLNDPEILRFHPRCPFGGQRRPALVALRRDIHSDDPCGIIRCALRPDGSDRDRDFKKADARASRWSGRQAQP